LVRYFPANLRACNTALPQSLLPFASRTSWHNPHPSNLRESRLPTPPSRLAGTLPTFSTLLHNLNQITQRRSFGRLRMHKKYRCITRSRSRRRINNLKSLLLQRVERLLDICYA